MNKFFFMTILILNFFCAGCSFLPLSKDVDWGEFLCQIDFNATRTMFLKNNNGNLKLTVFPLDSAPYMEYDNTPQKIEINDLNIDIIKRPPGSQWLGGRSFDHGVTEEVFLYTEKHPNEIEWDKRYEILWVKRIDKLSQCDMVYDDIGTPLFAVALQESNELNHRYFLQILASEDGSLLDTYSVDLPEDVSGPYWSFSDDLVYLIHYDSFDEHGKWPICFFKLDSKSKRYLLTKRMDALALNNVNDKYLDYIKIENGIAVISFERGTRRHLTNRQTIIFYDLLNQKILFEYSFHAMESISGAAISQDRKYVALNVGAGWYKSQIRLYKIKDMEKSPER